MLQRWFPLVIFTADIQTCYRWKGKGKQFIETVDTSFENSLNCVRVGAMHPSKLLKED